MRRDQAGLSVIVGPSPAGRIAANGFVVAVALGSLAVWLSDPRDHGVYPCLGVVFVMAIGIASYAAHSPCTVDARGLAGFRFPFRRTRIAWNEIVRVEHDVNLHALRVHAPGRVSLTVLEGSRNLDALAVKLLQHVHVFDAGAKLLVDRHSATSPRPAGLAVDGAPPLARAALADVAVESALARGRVVDAHRLLEKLAAGSADPLERAAIESLLRARRRFLEPLAAKPPLILGNGFGGALFFRDDANQDGSYIATYCSVGLGIPFVPLAAYVVRDAPRDDADRRRYQIIGRVPMTRRERSWRAAAWTTGAILAIGAPFVLGVGPGLLLAAFVGFAMAPGFLLHTLAR